MSLLIPPAWLVRPDEGPGSSASSPDLHGDVDALIQTLGETVNRIHHVDISTCQGAGGAEGHLGWEVLADELVRRVEDGVVDTAMMPDPYSRYEPARLLEVWLDGRPKNEDLVLCHGYPMLESLFFEDAESGLGQEPEQANGQSTATKLSFSGSDQLGSLRICDRHLDLAIIHHDLHERLGPESVFRFYEAYGSDPDLLRLDHYRLASLLLHDSPTAG